MSDDENKEVGKPFFVEKAKQGRAKCKKCKQNCVAQELRIAKLVSNPFGDGLMKQWYHVNCIFEQFLNQRATTKRIEDSYDMDGWTDLDETDKQAILKLIKESEEKVAVKFGNKYSPRKVQAKENPKDNLETREKDAQKSVRNTIATVSMVDENHKDNLFREFRRLVAEVTNENSYLEKSAIMNKMFTKGSDGTGFKGNLMQWVRLLIPGVIKRIYNLQSKQLIKLFNVIFETNREEMIQHLEQGDIAETILHFFQNSNTIKPCKKSLLSIQRVDNFLEELSKFTKEDEQIHHFKKIVKECTGNDLKIIIRLIKNDLRMNAGAKHVLDAVHADAYSAFQSSRDLSLVIKRIFDMQDHNSASNSKEIKATIKVMTPVLPMLAEACKSVEQAMKKCPNGMYSEIKYDGERVQVHKRGLDFKYYSRSLKPVLPHKVNHFKEYIPQAFPHAKDLILDSEVLLIDTQNGKPLPFGSLGVHKKEEFKDANVCLFVFDCIYYNGESLAHKPIKERRQILKENMTEIENHIMFSEMEEIHKSKDLAAMIAKVLNMGLEGLVLKDLMSIYEPGKRHWLKVKKDYLLGGAMADSADLIVLGAWYGTGKKGGMMSVFLMGCYDKDAQIYCTVTKVHTGHDDKTLEQLQTELDMVKISSEISKVPSWLKCTKTMVPDFVARNPKKQPVWEITGAEFTQHDVHTAKGISIRFPRVTKIRNDKTWETATSLEELQVLYKNSKENADYSSLLKTEDPDINEKPMKPKQNKLDDYVKSDLNSEMKIIEETFINNNKREHDVREVKSAKKMKEEYADPGPSKPKKIQNYAELTKEAEKDQIKREKSNKIKYPCNAQELKIKTEKNVSFIIRYPDIFKNVKLLPLQNVRENNEALIRQFTACDGNLLNEYQWESATHVVHNEESFIEKKTPKNFHPFTRHVTIDWIKDSIGNNEIQDTRPYAVQWITS